MSVDGEKSFTGKGGSNALEAAVILNGAFTQLRGSGVYAVY